MKKKYPKSAIKLIFQLNPFAPVSQLLNEIPCTLLGQETAKLPNVKVRALEKTSATWPDPRSGYFLVKHNFYLRLLLSKCIASASESSSINFIIVSSSMSAFKCNNLSLVFNSEIFQS